MTAIAPDILYVVAPDVPPELTLNEYRRRRPRRRRSDLRRLAGASLTFLRRAV